MNLFLFYNNIMILGNTFYTVTEPPVHLTQSHIYKIGFNANDEIFKAHFPGQPIVPGACLVQISKEIIEDMLLKSIQILQFKQLKFLTTMNPSEFPDVKVNIQIINDLNNQMALIKFQKNDTLFARFDYIFQH